MGVDIDAQSVKTAKENAEINGIENRTEFIVGDLAEKITDKYDIVCANIVADVIIRLFGNVRDYMKADARLLISGIIDIRADEIERQAEKHGFKIIQRCVRENWHAYMLEYIGGNEC